MVFSQEIMSLGLKLLRPINPLEFDFAYRETRVRDEQKEQIEAFVKAYSQEILSVNGYCNCRVDLWRVHKQEGYLQVVVDRLLKEPDYTQMKRRADYLLKLLKSSEDLEDMKIVPSLRLLYQSIHFPMLFDKETGSFSKQFLERTLAYPLRKAPKDYVVQLLKLCEGIQRCP